ncbi:hypothetical protein Syun_019552 [Stephania yunnanensis]|uniref:Uncharacterized protein n=1 Tax=Stephania yunnanensis TaxID=152371 RepID=A0AAP0IVI0_9MAGN
MALSPRLDSLLCVNFQGPLGLSQAAKYLDYVGLVSARVDGSRIYLRPSGEMEGVPLTCNSVWRDSSVNYSWGLVTISLRMVPALFKIHDLSQFMSLVGGMKGKCRGNMHVIAYKRCCIWQMFE